LKKGIKYESRPLKAWGKAKEYREKYYAEYADAHKEGKLRWVGGAETMDALVAGFGDQAFMCSEGYSASIGNNPKFSLECQEALEARGFARDLCAYLRNYWGSMFLNKYLWGGEFPRPDFALQAHICCLHAKWYQLVAEYEGIPHFSIDAAVGPTAEAKDLSHRIDYVTGQCLDAIEWMQKVTGREYDDEKLIEAVYQEAKNTSLWSEICNLNKAIPAPLDEKSMYSLYVLAVLWKSDKRVGEIYEELKAEVEDRVQNQIAAVPTERFRIIHDIQPPWAFLKIFRYLEEYGVVSVGSVYTFTLMGTWDFIDGRLVPSVPPQKQDIKLKTREDAVRFMVEWYLTKKPILDTFYEGCSTKSTYMLSLLRDWKAGAAIIHFNRGCEGLSLHCAENKLALTRAGIPVLTYEGNMADDREFDPVATVARVDAFMESLELGRLT